jgi:hydroxymethylglutaryl-CoA lyase
VRAASSLVLPDRVFIREVVTRDGLQLETPVSTEAKLAIIDAVVAAGLRRVEITAFVSPRAVPSMADAALVAAQVQRWPGVTCSALVPNYRSAQRALDAGVVNLEYVISAADGHSLANTRRTTREAQAEVRAIAELVHGASGTLEVIIATAWDCPFDGPTPPERALEVARSAVADGADQLCLGDTIGTVTPRRTVALIEAVRQDCPGVDLGVHLHNTRGVGLACALAAVHAGVTSLDASVGGLGGCPFAPGASGNIATEELVYLLGDDGVETGIDLDRLLESARIVEQAVHHPLTSSLYRAGGRSAPRGRTAAAA